MSYLNVSAPLGHAGLLLVCTKFHSPSGKTSHAFGCRVGISDQIAYFLQNYFSERGGMWLGMLDKTLHFHALSSSLYFFFKQCNHLQNMLSVNYNKDFGLPALLASFI